jgi:hypothetical protein
MQTATMYGREISVAVDSLIYVDGRTIGERLLPGDEPCEGWPGCQFRLPSFQLPAGLACNVRVVGRTMQRKYGELCVRVQIEWVNDGEPNNHCAGWLVVE